MYNVIWSYPPQPSPAPPGTLIQIHPEFTYSFSLLLKIHDIKWKFISVTIIVEQTILLSAKYSPKMPYSLDPKIAARQKTHNYKRVTSQKLKKKCICSLEYGSRQTSGMSHYIWWTKKEHEIFVSEQPNTSYAEVSVIQLRVEPNYTPFLFEIYKPLSPIGANPPCIGVGSSKETQAMLQQPHLLQWAMSNSCSAGGGSLGALSLSLLDFDWLYLVRTATFPTSSYVSWPCQVHQKAFHSSLLHPLLLTVILSPLLGCSLNHGWREVGINDSLIDEYRDSFILSTLASCESLN